jgi:hypothetical protein
MNLSFSRLFLYPLFTLPRCFHWTGLRTLWQVFHRPVGELPVDDTNQKLKPKFTLSESFYKLL